MPSSYCTVAHVVDCFPSRHVSVLNSFLFGRICRRMLTFPRCTGALFTDLAPTAVAIGSYFILADLILVGQCMYYNTSNASRARHSQHVGQLYTSGGTSEEAPLLGARRGSSASNSAAVGASAGMDSLGKILAGDDDGQENLSWWQNGVSLLAVYVIGVGAWAISYMVGVWDSGDSSPQPSPSDDLPHIIGMALGYLSAAFYLCARIPQIVKNYREQSCEGPTYPFLLFIPNIINHSHKRHQSCRMLISLQVLPSSSSCYP
jgi:hypothetical protein